MHNSEFKASLVYIVVEQPGLCKETPSQNKIKMKTKLKMSAGPQSKLTHVSFLCPHCAYFCFH